MRFHNGSVGLNVRIDGAADAPPLLLLHGITSSSETWDWMVPRVVDRFRVIRLDFRGHGESDRAPGEYGIAHYVGDATAVCEQVIGSPAAVVGHSLGGGTAAGLAQTRPDLTRAILVEDAPLADRARERIRVGHVLVQGFAVLRDQIPRLQRGGLTVDQVAELIAVAPLAGGRPGADVLCDDAIRSMATALLRVDASVLNPVVQGTQRLVADIDRPIEVPVVAVAADPASPDAVTTPEDLHRLAAASLRVETHTVAGSGHLIHYSKEDRETFWSIVDQFLANLPRAAS